MAIIELNKKNHILEDRLLTLELLVRRIEEQSIEIQNTGNVFNGLLSEIRQQRDQIGGRLFRSFSNRFFPAQWIADNGIRNFVINGRLGILGGK
jgi:hypothetical protein